ncbi:Cullin-domain-containing protein [Wilcoxina mikolae CBS 423.85]|nr:Cullin-domain-containing protein [Wilcoxina mikolae CBS 423.85]
MQIDCGRKDVWEAYVLCLIRWKRDIFDHIKERMLTAILELVEDHREDIPIDHVALNTATQSFATLGVDILNDPTRSNLDLYWRYFEIPFLKATTEYYDSASSQFLETHCITDYLRQVQVWLSQERTLVSDCFHPDTCGPLIRTCRKALLEDRVVLIGEEFLRHLEGDNQSELKLMLNLLSTTHKAMDQFQLRFSQHLSKVELSTAVTSAKGTVDSSMANAYVGELLKLHTHYQILLETLFARDVKFVRCFDEWFLKFVNHNNICPPGSVKSAMLLAANADSLLRESSHSMLESELAEKLASIMKIFQYLADKDTFHLAYSKRMADRFLKGRSASVQAEKLMIGILREACGNDFTRKLDTMLEDTKISSALNLGFQSWLCESKRAGVCAGLSFQVLRAGSWPLAIDGNPAGTFLFVPPKTIAYAHALFHEFYTARHNGRKLIWMWHLCNGELQANFKVSYIFRVSAYQMAILLLFNDHTTISYDFIELSTGLGGTDLSPVLSALMNVGVLVASPPGTNPGRDTRFSINPNFKSNKRIVSFRHGRGEMKQDEIKRDDVKQDENGTIKVENDKKRPPLFRRPYRRGPSWGKC